MRFYPDIKPHISPSALDAWHNSRGKFVRSYFIGEKSPETSSMKGGKKIHAMAEAGLLEVVHRFEHREVTLTQELAVEGVTYKVLGIPDGYERHWSGSKEGEGEPADMAYFVDYKSGKENTWDGVKLAGDLKMKTTAWLVWNATGKPLKVTGYIEYIPTVYNPVIKEVEPSGQPSLEVAKITYTAADLEAFTESILKTIDEVNTGYEEWIQSTDEFINQADVAEYAQLDQEVRERETRMAELLERIADQMKLGGKESIPSPFGSFYFTSKKKYEPIPETWAVVVDENYTTNYGVAEKVIAAASAAKKKFELEHDPLEVTKALAFRVKKDKK